MSLRIVAVSGPGALRYEDLALAIYKGEGLAGKIPLEDMAVLVLDGPDLSLSHQLLAACADAGVAVVTADAKHMPNGLLLPLAGHSLHSATLRAQIEAKRPAQKRAWQAIVKAKIRAQADLIAHVGGNDYGVRRLMPLVKSGDPDNVEARAAARYFDALFGEDFIRNRSEPGLNAMLNYGYAVLRSTVARALVGAGLMPALGIHHRNQYNPFCLADDAMEPLRPMVDRLAREAADEGDVPSELDPAAKRRMLALLTGFVRLEGLRFPLLVGLERYAASLRRSICEGEPLGVPIPDLS